jgi:membrane protease YdiL (CAAX protease family)
VIGTLRRSLLEAYAHRPVRIDGIPYQTAATTWAWFWRDLLIRVPPIVGLPIARGLYEGDFPGFAGMDVYGWALTLGATAAVLGVCTWFVFRYPSQQYRYTTGGLIIGGIFFLITNPVAEELFWRAFVQDIMADWLGFWPALLLTSLVFGLHHWFAGFGARFITLATVGGVAFGLLFEWTGSLLAPIIAHSVADLALFVTGPPLKLRRSLAAANLSS